MATSDARARRPPNHSHPHFSLIVSWHIYQIADRPLSVATGSQVPVDVGLRAVLGGTSLHTLPALRSDFADASSLPAFPLAVHIRGDRGDNDYTLHDILVVDIDAEKGESARHDTENHHANYGAPNAADSTG